MGRNLLLVVTSTISSYYMIHPHDCLTNSNTHSYNPTAVGSMANTLASWNGFWALRLINVLTALSTSIKPNISMTYSTSLFRTVRQWRFRDVYRTRLMESKALLKLQAMKKLSACASYLTYNLWVHYYTFRSCLVLILLITCRFYVHLCKTQATNVMRLLNRSYFMLVARAIYRSNIRVHLPFLSVYMNIAIILSGLMDSIASRTHLGQCLVQPVDMWSSSAEVQLPGKRVNLTLLLTPWRWLNTALHPELRKKYPSFATYFLSCTCSLMVQ